MKIGIIGFSKYVRKVYLHYLLANLDVEIAAICDTKEIDNYNILFENEKKSPLFFKKIEYMTTSVRLDAVIISTPHTLHFEQALFCLQQGIHVYLDKPLACRYVDAVQLVNFAKKQKLKLAVGNQRRHEKPYEYIKELVQSGSLGEIKFINYLFANSPWVDYSKIWRGNPLLSGGGALMDIGYLAIDTLLWLLGQTPVSVCASTPDISDWDIERTIAIVLKFRKNIFANLLISYEAPEMSVQEELAIYGEKKTIFIRRFQAQRSISPPSIIELSGNGVIKEFSFDDLPVNSNPLNDFLLCINNDLPINSSGESHLNVVKLIENSYKSIAMRKTIEV